MNEHFKKLIEFAESLGTVKYAHLYRYGYSTVSGTTKNGEEFTLTLDIKEPEEND